VLAIDALVLRHAQSQGTCTRRPEEKDGSESDSSTPPIVSLSRARALSAASSELMYTKQEHCQHNSNTALTKWCVRLEVKKYRANVTADWGAATCTVKVAIAVNLMRL
jgi:hypothetical protein